MPHIVHNPARVAGPDGRFSHGIEVAPNARWLYTTGQIGADPDGYVPADIHEQCELVFGNLRAILAEAEMDFGDVVRMNAYLTSPDWIMPYAHARDAVLVEPYPASTVLIVPALALPEFKVEVEAVAAKA
jgi:enamine deaminase RidA (YjgF/YER057c/UK114 family)